MPIGAPELTADLIDDKVTDTFGDGDVIESGDLRIEVMHTPGHCADHWRFAFTATRRADRGRAVRGTVGGTRAPGATGFEDLKALGDGEAHEAAAGDPDPPGPSRAATIADEWDPNPFIRVWRGRAEEGAEPGTIGPPDAA